MRTVLSIRNRLSSTIQVLITRTVRPSSTSYSAHMKNKSMAPRPSDFETREEWQQAGWRWLVRSLHGRSLKHLQHSLEMALTPSEQRMCVLRAIIRDRLQAGHSYKKIQRELWVQPGMISWVKKSVQRGIYQSSWVKTKVDIKINQAKKWRATEKPLPARCRRTKYGRSSMW